MSIQILTDYFLQYGAFFIFLIVLLEYLNLPGFPAGVIMPLSGIWASKGEIHFGVVLILTVLAGLIGSWLLYLIGRLGGKTVLEISKAGAAHPGKNGDASEKGLHRCFYQ